MLSHAMLERYIVANGHLVIEGTETHGELKEALWHLWEHDYSACRLKWPPQPVVAFFPDRSVLKVGRGIGPKPRRKPVDIDLTSEAV